MIAGEGVIAADPAAAIEKSYAGGVTDEFVLPTVFTDPSGRPLALIRDGGSGIFFNFRADRARELTAALTSAEFSKFQRKASPSLAAFASLKRYDEAMPLPAAFSTTRLANIFGDVISKADIRQFRIAEAEKNAHVN